MTNTIKTYTLLLLTIMSFQSNAQENTVKTKKWGLETDVIQPFLPEIGIITLKFTRTILGEIGGKHGDIMLGAFIRPNVKHDVVDVIDEYMASIGYRHYFSKNLNFELQYYAGNVDAKKNKIDGKDYSGFVHFAEANLGYKLNILKLKSSTVYLNPQFGYLQGLNKELIIGPRNGKEDAFVQGKLQLGISF
ncbi:hypothetical protein [Flavobacterium sp.]|uniref:hypothetical protein n=1 Tax=Flavobacterium sp. TaxID=239 RepID=UPI00286D72B4|nr:hypothetical protein [Flavobacterium sp.]